MEHIMRKETYRIRRNQVTCIGQLEKGNIVRIISIDGRMCEITDGYCFDFVMIKELERIELDGY